MGRILAALLLRGRTGEGSHVVVSMTHGAHRLASHRLGGEPHGRLLTGALACYGIYACADDRHVTVGALEPVFFGRLCELLGRPELAGRQYDASAQDELAEALGSAFAKRPLADWLALFEHEDVCVGPVATLEEAALDFSEPDVGHAPAVGEHTGSLRSELGLA